MIVVGGRIEERTHQHTRPTDVRTAKDKNVSFTCFKQQPRGILSLLLLAIDLYHVIATVLTSLAASDGQTRRSSDAKRNLHFSLRGKGQSSPFICFRVAWAPLNSIRPIITVF